jgi:hypothetical protein
VTKNPRKMNLKEEGVILAHSFRGFSLWLLGLVAVRPMTRKYIIMEEHVRRKLLMSQKLKRRWGGFRVPICPLGYSPNGLLSPTSS